MKRTTTMLGASALAAIALIAVWQSTTPDPESQVQLSDGAALVTVNIPTIEGTAAIGQRIFDTACAACHGTNAAGKNGYAPPLVHKVYEPSHHGDEAFQRAVSLGVKSHHWSFGDMPPVQGLTRGDVTMVIAYIRELQRANGIN